MYFYLWKHHLTLLHGMVAEYIGRAIAIGMPDQQSRVYEKQLARPASRDRIHVHARLRFWHTAFDVYVTCLGCCCLQW